MMDGLLSCKICGQREGLITEEDLKTHMLLQHEEKEGLLSCQICGHQEGLVTEDDLKTHLFLAHEEKEGLLSCEICGQREGMVTEDDLKTHMFLEHEEKGPTCLLCNLSELTLEELELHMNTAHEDVLSPGASRGKTTGDVISSTPKGGSTSRKGTKVGEEVSEELELHINTAHEDVLSPGTDRGKTTGDLNGANPKKRPKPKMAAVFPNAAPTNRAAERDVKPQEFELSDISHGKNTPSTSSNNYPLQLRAPEHTEINSYQDRDKTSHPNGQAQNESLEMASFGLDGSMLLISDSEDDNISVPGSSTDSPSRKRPRNSTLNSDSSSISNEGARQGDIRKSPFKRLLDTFTPKKMGERNGSGSSTSGIWTDSEELVSDVTSQNSGSQRLEDSEGKPECPFCDLWGLKPEEMSLHIENEHGNLLSPNDALGQRRSKLEPKPTLLSLSKQAKNINSAITCPMCGLGSFSPEFITKHINSEHPDMGTSNTALPNGAAATPGTSGSPCPICGLKGLSEAALHDHVEGHFVEDAATREEELVCSEDNRLARALAEQEKELQRKKEEEEFKKLQVRNPREGALREGAVREEELVCSEDNRLARELAEQEKELQRKKEEEEFKKLQAQYGMDGTTGYQQQSETALERAVARGQMSVADYNQQRGRLQQVVATGMDDGRSRTQGLMDKIEEFYTKDNRNVSYGRVCGDMDHFGATPGDRGWGCGYRNLQMLLSGMVKDPTYRDVVFNGRDAIPAIGKLQQLIEAAWGQGWDPQGREQLGGKVCNTKKWIGATEVVAMLSYLKTKYVLIDFHKPTGPNGTHPKMFEWVRDYFGQPGARLFNRGNQIKTKKPPLYLQHQGHSRTIIGYEVLKNGAIRLLIFDPSTSHDDMQALRLMDLSAQAMHPLRKSLAQMKAKQYQIVGVVGVYGNDREHRASKMIHSVRIP